MIDSLELKMGDLLFNPNGRLLKHRFWQGLVILTVGSVIVSAGTLMVAEIIGILDFILLYCYVCVYGKRLHDSGNSAWWVIAIGIASFVLMLVLLFIFLVTILPSIMTPDQRETLEEMIKLAEAGDETQFMKGAEYLLEQLDGTFRRASIALTIIANAIMGLLIGRLKTIPKDNQYGPVPYHAS